MSKISSSAIIIVLTLILWSSAATISYYSAKNHQVLKTEQRGESKQQLSPETQALIEKSKQTPDDYRLHLELAKNIQQEAFSNSDPNILMQAVDEYKKALELKPNYPEALLGLAGLCMDAGILDQATKYYESYLKQRPDDIEAKTDYALSLVESNKLDLAEKILKENITQDKSLKNLLALSLVYKAKTDIKTALDYANQALALANSAEDKNRVNEYIASINNQKTVDPDSNNLSPATLVEQYFKGHEIIGPKVAQITWRNLNQVEISLQHFPIENMPPFAKEKMINNIKEKFKILPNIITIKFISAETQKELLSIEVGSSKQ